MKLKTKILSAVACIVMLCALSLTVFATGAGIGGGSGGVIGGGMADELPFGADGDILGTENDGALSPDGYTGNRSGNRTGDTGNAGNAGDTGNAGNAGDTGNAGSIGNAGDANGDGLLDDGVDETLGDRDGDGVVEDDGDKTSTDVSEKGMSWTWLIIAVLVAAAVVALIVALIPKKK